jgi:hypothetical protein
MAAVVRAPGIENLNDFLRHQLGEIRADELPRFRTIDRILGAIGTLISDDKIDVPTPAQGSVAREAREGREIVRLLTHAMVVEALDSCVHDPRWIKVIQRPRARLSYPGGLILKPGLIGRHLACLSRTGCALELLETLPAKPAEFVVVPHVDERPSSARVLDIRIVQVGAVDRPIIIECRRYMKILDLLAILVPHDVPKLTVVHALWSICRVPD